MWKASSLPSLPPHRAPPPHVHCPSHPPFTTGLPTPLQPPDASPYWSLGPPGCHCRSPRPEVLSSLQRVQGWAGLKAHSLAHAPRGQGHFPMGLACIHPSPPPDRTPASLQNCPCPPAPSMSHVLLRSPLQSLCHLLLAVHSLHPPKAQVSHSSLRAADPHPGSGWSPATWGLGPWAASAPVGPGQQQRPSVLHQWVPVGAAGELMGAPFPWGPSPCTEIEWGH